MELRDLEASHQAAREKEEEARRARNAEMRHTIANAMAVVHDHEAHDALDALESFEAARTEQYEAEAAAEAHRLRALHERVTAHHTVWRRATVRSQERQEKGAPPPEPASWFGWLFVK